jgi:hypothetical protein
MPWLSCKVLNCLEATLQENIRQYGSKLTLNICRGLINFHQIRITSARELGASSKLADNAIKDSMDTILTFIRITRDICDKFTESVTSDNIAMVPLPAVFSTGETVLAALQLNQLLDPEKQVNYDSLKLTLSLSTTRWKLCGKFPLKKL